MKNIPKSEFIRKNIIKFNQLIKIFNENSKNILKNLLQEDNVDEYGIDVKPIDGTDKEAISFNPTHEDLIDTNNLYEPHINISRIGSYPLLSVFIRKSGKAGRRSSDGNPLIQLLKQKNNKYCFRSKADAIALFRRFLAVLGTINSKYDTIILTPSTNILNNYFFKYAIKYIQPEFYIQGVFKKRRANDVKADFEKTEFYKNMFSNGKNLSKLIELNRDFEDMNLTNSGIFSYSKIKDVGLRKYMPNTIIVNNNFITPEIAEHINDKNILIIDDTVTTGSTLSTSADAIWSTFKPKTITFLTIFSSKDNEAIDDPFNY